MNSYRRALWLYPIFQIPLICLGICLLLAALFWVLKFGRPQVAVAIALDLSGSTYGNQVELFNAPGTILDREVKAVQAYLRQNNQEILRYPNQVKILGFGGAVQPLTEEFESNSDRVARELQQALTSAELPLAVIPDDTNVNLAIETGIKALKTVPDFCRELILVTDGIEGQAIVAPTIITEAKINQIKINSVVIGQEALALRATALSTGGKYLSGNSEDLNGFFAQNFFNSFNSNLNWIIFWLGLAWVSLMWLLILPLDRWVFQKIFKMRMDTSGKLAIANAVFWTIATLLILWQTWGIPFLWRC
ncbi:MAG TPA: VWA domain-containing protein [Xenococcaceae cyanobacterium]|jgi:Ca-activated chloride channel family protein